jgi:hypothetical protein
LTALLAGLRIGADTQDEDAWRQTIIEKCKELHHFFKGEKISLKVLEAFLVEVKSKSGLSNNKLRAMLRSIGICLSNCLVLYSAANLSDYLWEHWEMRIKRKSAKKYALVKYCLVQVDDE